MTAISRATGIGDGPTRTELVWPGKNTQVERIALPFQVIETINQSRATREQTPIFAGLPPPPLFEGRFNPSASSGQAPDTAWKNKLIWGENKYVLASLLQGDPSIGLEPLAGKVNLIYIDPPFATGQDFSYRVRVGDEELVKEASIIEETAYRDTWGRGLDSYLQMMYERLVLMRELLAEDGSIYVHLDSNMGGYLKCMMDEVFGTENFRNEIVVNRTRKNFIESKTVFSLNVAFDTLYIYAKSQTHRMNPPYRQVARQERWHALDAPNWSGGRPNLIYELFGRLPPQGRCWAWEREKAQEAIRDGSLRPNPKTGKPEYLISASDTELANNLWADLNAYSFQTGYPTEKSEKLLERVLQASSNPGGLVADFFIGSGTTMAVAEKLGRRWVGCDLSRYAIQVSRKRMLDISGCQPFQVLNLGKYERQHWQVNVLNGRQQDGSKAIADYLRFIVALYRAEAVGGYVHLHGQKAGRWVHVGASDAPVTQAEIVDAVRECQANRYTGLDVLGWEWEMGLHDTIRDEARRMGVDLRMLYIPREVMDKRAVQAGDIHFYELAYLKTALLQNGRTVTVRLEDFIIPNLDLVPEEVRSKVKRWSDYIDFWAVDWNYQGDTFHNEWQTYRTRKSPTLRLISDPHDYSQPGNYRVLVKVIDIFGNDTTQLLEVTI